MTRRLLPDRCQVQPGGNASERTTSDTNNATRDTQSMQTTFSPLLLDPQTDLSELPEPGKLVVYDYGTLRGEETSRSVRAVQWNIERGYKLDGIIHLLAHGTATGIDVPSDDSADAFAYRDADVLALQELDLHCARSHYRNSAQELARALSMRCLFVAEFEELWSRELRRPQTQGGGVHGNAILTWWDVERVDIIDHVAVFDWNADGARLGEPRRGGRYTLAAFLRHPHRPEQRILVYSAHLEVFCGIFGRMRQFSQILEHAHRHAATTPHQLLLGDLNTMAHGLARFFPKYCCDALRWRSVGWSEAEWWQRNLFSVTPELARDPTTGHLRNVLLAAHHHSAPRQGREDRVRSARQSKLDLLHRLSTSSHVDDDTPGDSAELARECRNLNLNAAHGEGECHGYLSNESNSQQPSARRHARPIFSTTELANLVNPHFFCPFSPRTDLTLAVRGYSGKLDWMLARGWRILRRGVDNDAYDRSDHKLLWMEVEAWTGEGDPGPEAYFDHVARNQEPRRRLATLTRPHSLLGASYARWAVGVGLVSVVLCCLWLQK